jgi:hypothetical protein
MRPVDVSMISTDGCARDVMVITRMRFEQEAELGRTALASESAGPGEAPRAALRRGVSFDHLVGERQELTWTTQRQITLTSPFQNAITTLTLGFPPSSVSSCTATRITTLGFFARAFAHSRSTISAFSTSVSRRRVNILRDKWLRPRRAAEQRDEHAAVQRRDHSMTSSARASTVAGTSRPSALAVLRFTIRSNLVGCCTGSSAGFSPFRMRST